MIGALKSGTGKTCTTYNLTYSLQKLGKKVLAVDFDSQANLTIGSLMMNMMNDEELPDPENYIMHRNGVDFIPSSLALSAVDAKLRLEMGAEKILEGILNPLRDRYDWILIDCLCG